MKKKIIILGSTGSIGKSTINIIKKNKKDFNVILLTTNNNYKEILKKSKFLKVKNLVINNYKYYLLLKKKLKGKKINIYNNIETFNKNFKSRVDYTMCAISGLAGLKPTLDSIKISKKVAIANKESLICGWNLIKKKLKKHKTKFIPVDSEHFSIWSLIENFDNSDIEKIIITASGGPFLKLPLNKFKNITPSRAVNHPRWKMGKKISVDSATMMNKVFEVIEAQRIFNIDINKFKILIHPNSYVHAIIKFKNGLIKILVHETDMTIPIFNSIYNSKKEVNFSKKINLNYLNNLNFIKVDSKRFPSTNILKIVPNKLSLYETALISCNDELVDLFLNNKISFKSIVNYLKKLLRMKVFLKYKKRQPKSLNELIKVSNFARLKTRSLCI